MLQVFSSWSLSWRCITLTSVVATATKLGLLIFLGLLLQWHMPWWAPNTPPTTAGIVDGKCIKSIPNICHLLQMGRFCVTRLPYIPIHASSVTKTWRDSLSFSMGKTWHLSEIHATLVFWIARMTLISMEEGKFLMAERMMVKRTSTRYLCWDHVMRWKNI